jgi:hypothetical protein
MTVASQPRNRYLDRPAPSSLADVLDTILDKGLVIDIYVRVSLVGIELLTIDARIVIASVDTYLRFAEAVNRLDLTETETHGIPELMEDVSNSGSKGKTEGAIEVAPSAWSRRWRRRLAVELVAVTDVPAVTHHLASHANPSAADRVRRGCCGCRCVVPGSQPLATVPRPSLCP